MIVELEPRVWIADGRGDPPHTLLEENAKRFKTLVEAAKALTKARKYRPFLNASIEDDLFS